ncbi:hypothetical protein [Dactylosporangium sp. CA-139066]|uniref:hypothetical protein n=1 Tax=Dactylosporangium sp. CA-139066 TaxID=3239930 RepID=UPI003D8D0423
MGIGDEAVTRLRAEYPDIGALARQPGVLPRPGGSPDRFGARSAPGGDPPGPVMAVRLSIEGVRGGRTPAAGLRCRYVLVVDVSKPAGRIPSIWVRSPADRDIEHVNIWPASREYCPWMRAWLPSLCWNTFAVGWHQAPPAHRTLGTVLEYAKQLLNTENHESPAR